MGRPGDFRLGRPSFPGRRGSPRRPLDLGLAVVFTVSLFLVSGWRVQAEESRSDQVPIRLLDERLPVVEGAHPQAEMVIWTEGRRAFQFLAGQPTGINAIASIDLDTFKEVARSGAFVPRFEDTLYRVEVDEERGWLLVPQIPGRNGPGIWVIDARSLEAIRNIAPPSDAPITRTIAALSYSPPRALQDAGKLYLLLWDTQTEVAGTFTPFTSTNNHIFQVAEVDPATGDQRVLGRVNACTNRRDDIYSANRHSYTISRSPDIERPSLYVGCYGSGRGAQVVKLLLDENGSVTSIREQQNFPGPRFAAGILSDPGSDRVLVKEIPQGGQVGNAWWVFDGRVPAYVGVVGIGPYAPDVVAVGEDPQAGRMYWLAPPASGAGGLYVADIRREPVPQSVRFPEYAEYASRSTNNLMMIVVDSEQDGRPTRAFVRPGAPTVANPREYPYYLILEDSLPISQDLASNDYLSSTVDVPEKEGVTMSNFTGSARGYGLRVILVGGLGAATRTPLADVTLGFGPCSSPDRELIFGSVGPSVYTDANVSAKAHAVSADDQTRADFERPLSRCGGQAFQNLWSSLGPNPPVAEPSVPLLLDSAECKPGTPADSVSDPTLTAFAAEVTCDPEPTGWARGGTLDLGPVTVAEAYSTLRISRHPVKGLVASVESVARGIHIVGSGGAVTIGSINASVESWANGRNQPSSVDQGPECYGKTAGTCYRRSISGFQAPGFSCTQCAGREPEMVAAINRVLGKEGRARLRSPDEILRKGTANGYLAALLKPSNELFGDRVLNNDGLSVLPALEIVRYADGSGGRGRQIYQFAGVESAVAYGIELLSQILPFESPTVVDEFVAEEQMSDSSFFAGASSSPEVRGRQEPLLKRLLQKAREKARDVLEGLRLLLSSPREAALLASVWALLVIPAYLSERRRILDRLAAERLGGTGC